MLWKHVVRCVNYANNQYIINMDDIRQEKSKDLNKLHQTRHLKHTHQGVYGFPGLEKINSMT